MIRNLILALILVFALPWLELFVFLPEIFRQFGFITGLTWLVVTVYIGLILIRTRPPINQSNELPDNYQKVSFYFKSMLYKLAGSLFIFPGIMTDIAALILIIPPVQNYLIKNFFGNVTEHYKTDPKIIEGEWKTKKVIKSTQKTLTKKIDKS